MWAYRGVVKAGVVVLESGNKLPDGTVVTVTVSEGEISRATLRNVFKRAERPARIPLRPNQS
jgi:RNase P protein component